MPQRPSPPLTSHHIFWLTYKGPGSRLTIKPLYLVGHTHLWRGTSVTLLWHFLWYFNTVTKTLTTLCITLTFSLLTTRPSATSPALEARFWTHWVRSFYSTAHIGISSFPAFHPVEFCSESRTFPGREGWFTSKEGELMMCFDDWCWLKWTGRCRTCAWWSWMAPPVCCAPCSLVLLVLPMLPLMPAKKCKFPKFY